MTTDTVSFNLPARTGNEAQYVQQVIDQQLTGDHFSLACEKLLRQYTTAQDVFLVPSCTHALEMAALLLDIRQGDEVIMPSFTFTSSANAFVLRGAVPVFVDIRPDTMNIDEALIEQAITPKTKAILVMHYGGVACQMDVIMRIADKHKLRVVEDAAHALMGKWNGQSLGTIGHIGAYSFHQTKNLTAGEGGAIVLNDAKLVKRAEKLRCNGTNRMGFMRGEAAFYSWVDIGSNWNLSELNAAYLYSNLLAAEDITRKRRNIWDFYQSELAVLEKQRQLTLPVVPEEAEHCAHVFFLKVTDHAIRDKLIQFLKEQDIIALFHYIPLHNSVAGKTFGRFAGEDHYTTQESERLVRLPLFYNMTMEQAKHVVDAVHRFYHA